MRIKPTLLRLTIAAAFSVPLFASDEADVRAALMNYTHALESMNLDQTMDCYANTPEVSVFSPGPHQAIIGKAAIRKDWEHFFSNLKSFRAEPQEVAITVINDVAIVHYTKVEEINFKSGDFPKPFMRTSQVYRKIGGRWLIDHEHYSTPFDK